MKKLFIIANWKSNKDSIQVNDWVEGLKDCDLRFTNKEVIICPSFIHLPILKSYILDHKSPVRLGSQNISPFDEGAYTGEINGKQIKEFADYVIIGHSERRENFFESDEMFQKKVEMALKYNLKPIFCVQDDKTAIPRGVEIVVYEPIFAIGSGDPDTPENAEKIAEQIKTELNGATLVLYGGSVTSSNVKSFTQMENISGVLVGGASLNPLDFSQIVKLA